MRCERAIAKKIIDKKADYTLVLKGNKETLREDVALLVDTQKNRGIRRLPRQLRPNRRRRPRSHRDRRVTVIDGVGWLQQRHKWPGLKGVIVVDSVRKFAARTERETRCHLTSSSLGADRLGPTTSTR